MIPEAAVEAALVVLRRDDLWNLSDREECLAILEAAAPHLAPVWHDAVSGAYVEGALSAAAADVMWAKNPYR